MNTKIKKLVLTAMLTALVCITTMVVTVPSPLKGYINLGDCVVLLSAWLLPPIYGAFAAGVGSALADVLASYVVYAPATFVIKALMAVAANLIFCALSKKTPKLAARISGGVAAEVLMVLGYFLFEGFLYGFIPSAVNIAPNMLQGAVGIVLGIILIKLFEKNKITM